MCSLIKIDVCGNENNAKFDVENLYVLGGINIIECDHTYLQRLC